MWAYVLPALVVLVIIYGFIANYRHRKEIEWLESLPPGEFAKIDENY